MCVCGVAGSKAIECADVVEEMDKSMDEVDVVGSLRIVTLDGVKCG